MHEDYSQDNEDDAKEDYSGSGDSEAGEIEDGSDMKYELCHWMSMDVHDC